MGFEVLGGCRQSERGLFVPGEFIPVAHAAGRRNASFLASSPAPTAMVEDSTVGIAPGIAATVGTKAD